MITPITGGMSRENVIKINQLTEAVNRFEKITGGPGLNINKSAAGYSIALDIPTLIRKIRFIRPSGGGVNIKIFEVQAVAYDGIYNCYEKKLDSTEWTGTGGNDKFINAEETPTLIEVFNLNENCVLADYSPALAIYDLIEARQMKDDESNKRWAGRPLVTTPRRAITTEVAPASEHITCNLIDRFGNEITSGLGSAIEVYADACGTDTDLNSLTPRLGNDGIVYIVNKRGKWFFNFMYDSDTEDCGCYPTI